MDDQRTLAQVREDEIDSFIVEILSILSKHCEEVFDSRYLRDEGQDDTEPPLHDCIEPILNLLNVPSDNVSDDEDGQFLNYQPNYSRESLRNMIRFRTMNREEVSAFVRVCREDARMHRESLHAQDRPQKG